jgi:indolepyruvate ferredoxin oxidoreductase
LCVFIAPLHADNYRTAVALAELPEQIRGYGHIRNATWPGARAEQPAKGAHVG